MKNYPNCEHRYNPIGWELCNYSNEGIPNHKKKICSCCANVCPLGKYPEYEKITIKEMYKRDMKKIDGVLRSLKGEQRQ